MILVTNDTIENDDNVFIELLEIMESVIARLKGLDLDIPIYKIARMDLKHRFALPFPEPLKKDIYRFLRSANKYRRVHFNLKKYAEKVFDKEMKKDGSYGPQTREYKSLKIQLFKALLGGLRRGESKAWIRSYDSYITEIRAHSQKGAVEPRNGMEFYKSCRAKTKNRLTAIKKRQRSLIDEAKELCGEIESQKMEMWKGEA